MKYHYFATIPLLMWTLAAQVSATTPWLASSVVISGLPAHMANPIAVSASGDVFLALPPTPDVHVTNKAGDPAGGSFLIAKVNSSGNILWVLQLGGVNPVIAMVPDGFGNVYVAGAGTAAGLPVTPGAYRGTPAGIGTPYVCKLNSTNGSPLFCTYLDDNLMGLAAMSVDSAGNVYIAASKNTSAVGATPGAISAGNRDVLVMKFDPTGSKLILAAEFGGSGIDAPQRILVDAAEAIYVMGSTSSLDFPGAVNGPLPPPHSAGGVRVVAPFVAKLNADGTQIVYAVYGLANEGPLDMAADSAGEIHLLVQNEDTAQLLVRKYAADGTSILYQTVLAKDTNEASSCDQSFPSVVIAVDDQGVASIVGGTAAIGFPMHHATATCAAPGCANAYLVRLTPSGDIQQSTFLASNSQASVRSASVQSSGGYIAALIGTTNSQQPGLIRIGPDTTGRETALGCYGNAGSFQGGPLAPGEIFSIFGEGLGPVMGVPGGGTNQTAGTSLSGVAVTLDGAPAPLLYVQSAQINAIAPWEIAGKSQAQLCVSYGGNSSCTTAGVSQASPGFFQYPGADNILYPAAVNQDGTLNSLHPAPVGSIVSLYMTGLGMLSPVPTAGSVIQLPLPILASQVRVDFCANTPGPVPGFPACASVPAQVHYAGPAPFEVGGVYQVNVQVPDSGATGPLSGVLMLRVVAPDGSVYDTGATIAVK